MGQLCNSTKKNNSSENFAESIEIITWNQDKRSLFDYESKAFTKNILQLKPGTLSRQSNEVTLFQKRNPTNNKQFLGEIYQYYNQLFFCSSFKDSEQGLNENSIWQSLRPISPDFKQPIKYELYQGMVFRLGILRFRVKELKEEILGDHSKSVSLYENSPNRMESDEHFNVFPDHTSTCRICFGTHQTKMNPLISPCRCSGTMKCIHLRCLQKWIMSKVKKKYKNSAFSIFYWKDIMCELCKCPLECRTYFLFILIIKDHVDTDKHKNYSIIDIPKPHSRYLVLEILNLENNEVKGLHLITFADKKRLTIGRGQEVDIQMKDASISRVHASILFENDHFYLMDENSRFGTLVLQEKELQLNSLHPACGIQIGRSVFTIPKSGNKQMLLDQPLILQHPYSKQSSLEDKKPSQLCLGNNTLVIHSMHEVVDEESQEPISQQQQEDEEEESHNPYVFDEAPGLSLNSFTTQQLRKTQFPSFESSKFKMFEVNNQPAFKLNCEEKMMYMTSTELQKQISSNQTKY